MKKGFSSQVYKSSIKRYYNEKCEMFNISVYVKNNKEDGLQHKLLVSY